MTPADFYHRRAAECFVLALQIADPHERDIMRELALRWLSLLEQRTKRDPTIRANASRDQHIPGDGAGLIDRL